MTDKKLQHLQDLVISGEPGTVGSAIETVLDGGADPKAVLDMLTGAMDIAGEMWDRLEIYLPDVVRISKSMKEGMDIVKPKLSKDDINKAIDTDEVSKPADTGGDDGDASSQ